MQILCTGENLRALKIQELINSLRPCDAYMRQ